MIATLRKNAFVPLRISFFFPAAPSPLFAPPPLLLVAPILPSPLRD